MAEVVVQLLKRRFHAMGMGKMQPIDKAVLAREGALTDFQKRTGAANGTAAAG